MKIIALASLLLLSGCQALLNAGLLNKTDEYCDDHPQAPNYYCPDHAYGGTWH